MRIFRSGRAMTDWRQKAIDNQRTMADLHKSRTKSETKSLLRDFDRKAKQSKSIRTQREDRYWRKRAKIAEAALRRLAGAPKPAAGPSFYESQEWRVLRYKALKLHGKRCQLCGATDTTLHVDHIKPRSKYPELELRLDNLQVLCVDCNLGKGAWDQSDWRKGALKSIPGA